MGLLRAYSDMPEFRQRLQREIIGETYPKLHELRRPLSQDDIDDAIRTWNGDIQSKQAVIRYMEAHAPVSYTHLRLLCAAGEACVMLETTARLECEGVSFTARGRRTVQMCIRDRDRLPACIWNTRAGLRPTASPAPP